MTDHTWGVDKSHYDAPTGTARLVSEGFGFLTHKAGGDQNDPDLRAWWNDALPQRSNILLGAYWVLYPGHGAGAGDSFVARLDSQCPGWRDGPFILQLDCEEWNGDTGTMPHVADIRACALRLRQLAPKLVPIVYAPHWAYGNTLAGLGFPLWSSAYTTARGSASAIYPGDSYSGWAAYSGIVPTIAQFSSTATAGGDSTTDVNCFKGTPADLVALLAPGFGGTTMAITDDDAGVFWGHNIRPAGQPTYSGGGALGTILDRTNELNQLPDQMSAMEARLTAKITAIQSQQVDVVALAAALAPLLDGLTAPELESAIEQAVRDLVNGTAPAAHPDAVVRRDPGDNPSIYDETTRAMREQRQPGIQGGDQQ